MRALLNGIASASTRRPKVVIPVLIAITLMFGALATTNQFQVDLTRFSPPDAEPVKVMNLVREEFRDPAAVVQVILDAGPEGNMLTPEGMNAVRAAEDITLGTLGTRMRAGPDGEPLLLSLPRALGEAGDTAPIGPAAAQLVQRSPQFAGLVSDDIDLTEGRARATVLIAMLDPGHTTEQQDNAAKELERAFAESDAPALNDVRVTVYSIGLFIAGLLDAIRGEAPQLFGLALIVVLGILGLMYRSVADVAVGFAGLVMTVVWTFGFAALLGPSNLGVVGPLSQLAIIIPVLLVGLGIDYSVHLTARFREQRASGIEPTAAARGAVLTVGGALILATVATATGFATSAAAPLGIIADFGVITAIGVVCAFVVMTLLVPATLTLRSHRHRHPKPVREVKLGALLRGPTALARKAPAAGLAVALVLAGASMLAATTLDTRFDRQDFVPQGTAIADTLDHQGELFGTGVSEVTFVVIDGDFTDPDLVQAVAAAQSRLTEIPGVRSVGGTPQAVSVLTLLQSAPGRGGLPTSAEQLDAAYQQLQTVMGADQVSQFVAEDRQSGIVQIRTIAGDSGAFAVRDAILGAFAPVMQTGAAVSVTSEPLIIADMNLELGRFQMTAVGITLAVVTALLVGFYALSKRRPALGLIAMIPALTGAALIFGTMWVLGFDINVLSATLTAIAIGIGVPYGVHVVNRFSEELRELAPDTAIEQTLRHTGGALVGAALTTLGALAVLSISSLVPIRTLGLLGGAGIGFALLASLLVAPGALLLWARHHPSGLPAGVDTAQPQHIRASRG